MKYDAPWIQSTNSSLLLVNKLKKATVVALNRPITNSITFYHQIVSKNNYFFFASSFVFRALCIWCTLYTLMHMYLIFLPLQAKSVIPRRCQLISFRSLFWFYNERNCRTQIATAREKKEKQ